MPTKRLLGSATFPEIVGHGPTRVSVAILYTWGCVLVGPSTCEAQFSVYYAPAPQKWPEGGEDSLREVAKRSPPKLNAGQRGRRQSRGNGNAPAQRTFSLPSELADVRFRDILNIDKV